MKTTVIYHSADFDGLFCREIARKFLPDAELIGWDFADAPLAIPPEGPIYVLDLPVDRVFGDSFSGGSTTKWFCHREMLQRVIWIDHHASSIQSHPTDIPGYRIDGVAACRLAWQWFAAGNPIPNCGAKSKYMSGFPFPVKQDYADRKVSEPLSVRLVGEYDIWDKRNPDAEVFQFGLRSAELTPQYWNALLSNSAGGSHVIYDLLENGRILQRYQQEQDASIVKRLTFLVEFEGLKFLALNSPRFNSLTFAAVDVPESGHDALMGFRWDGKIWTVSLYHAKHRTDLDLSAIAQKYGGGGHRGACGFQSINFNPHCTLLFSV